MTVHKQDELKLECFWNLESVGIKLPEATDQATDFLHHYHDTSNTLKEQGYNAQLQWKPDHPPLPINADITESRTPSMVQHLAKDPQKLQ